MTPSLFSEPWAAALGRTIDQSAEYRKQGRQWNGVIILTDGTRGVVLDLAAGRCLDARPLAEGDHEEARVILGAEPETWDRMLTGDLDPIQAVMAREVRLEKGSFLELLPHIEGARIIFRSVRDVADSGGL